MNIRAIEILTFLISNIFYVYIVKAFCKAFFNNKIKLTRKQTQIIYGLYYLIITSVYYLFYMPMITLIIGLVATFVLTFLYKANLKQRLLAVMFVTVIIVFSELLVAYMFSAIMNMTVDYALNSSLYTIYITIASKILIFFFVNIFIKILRTKDDFVIPTTYWLAILFIPLFSIGLLCILFVMTYKISGTEHSVLAAIGVICTLIINVTTFVVYDKLVEFYEVKQENQLLNERIKYYNYNTSIETSNYDFLSTLRHDINHYMVCFQTFIENGNIEQVKRMAQELVGKFQDLPYEVKTDNMAIDAIINYKSSYAKAKGITFDFEAIIPQNMAIEPSDISVLLGNLLDNAIEATLLVEKADKTINISLSYNKGNLYISISNPYLMDLVNQDDKYKSTKENKTSHGIGLKSVEKVAQKYNGGVAIDTSNNVFRVDILLYNIKF